MHKPSGDGLRKAPLSVVVSKTTRIRMPRSANPALVRSGFGSPS